MPELLKVNRHAMFDDFAKVFLKEHAKSTGIEIWCGLSRRYKRLDNEDAEFGNEPKCQLFLKGFDNDCTKWKG